MYEKYPTMKTDFIYLTEPYIDAFSFYINY